MLRLIELERLLTDEQIRNRAHVMTFDIKLTEDQISLLRQISDCAKRIVVLESELNRLGYVPLMSQSVFCLDTATTLVNPAEDIAETVRSVLNGNGVIVE